MEKSRFSGKVAIITGGAQGMGFATAKRLASEGVKVYLFDMNGPLAREKAAMLGEDESYAVEIDVTDEEQVPAAIDAIYEKEGSIDYLVNMAGIPGPKGDTSEYDFAGFKQVFNVNVFGAFLMMQNCLKYMKKNEFGAIVSAASCSGMRGYKTEIGYGATKAAIIQMTRTIGNENGYNNVRCNCISPGYVWTEKMQEVMEKGGNRYNMENIPLGTIPRFATPEEMANCICFLLSDEASYVNGSNFVIDGGKTLG